MKRTMSSLRPLGAVTASMSVTKPYLYFCSAIERTCSIVSTLALIVPARSLRNRAVLDADARPRFGRGYSAAGATCIWRHHVRQGDRLQSRPNGGIDPIPASPHGAHRLDAAIAFRTVDAGRQ